MGWRSTADGRWRTEDGNVAGRCPAPRWGRGPQTPAVARCNRRDRQTRRHRHRLNLRTMQTRKLCRYSSSRRQAGVSSRGAVEVLRIVGHGRPPLCAVRHTVRHVRPWSGEVRVAFPGFPAQPGIRGGMLASASRAQQQRRAATTANGRRGTASSPEHGRLNGRRRGRPDDRLNGRLRRTATATATANGRRGMNPRPTGRQPRTAGAAQVRAQSTAG
jgi:hypothetical protein